MPGLKMEFCQARSGTGSNLYGEHGSKAGGGRLPGFTSPVSELPMPGLGPPLDRSGGEHVVKNAGLDIGYKSAQLLQAHLDPLAEVISDHDSFLGRGVSVQEQLRTTTTTLATEGHDVCEIT